VKWASIDIEDKTYSLAIHYRRAREKRSARKAIYDAVAALPTAMRIVPGKLVLNVVPALAPDKGDAFLDLRSKACADTALFVGDDVTDEDVFKLDEPGRLVSVRVGESKSSSAMYFLRDQRAIDTLLARLVALRERHGSR
jgi:trehalose 6-phosphate phosphatase